jgi:hypothetical protein
LLPWQQQRSKLHQLKVTFTFPSIVRVRESA